MKSSYVLMMNGNYVKGTLQVVNNQEAEAKITLTDNLEDALILKEETAKEILDDFGSLFSLTLHRVLFVLKDESNGNYLNSVDVGFTDQSRTTANWCEDLDYALVFKNVEMAERVLAFLDGSMLGATVGVPESTQVEAKFYPMWTEVCDEAL